MKIDLLTVGVASVATLRGAHLGAPLHLLIETHLFSR